MTAHMDGHGLDPGRLGHALRWCQDLHVAPSDRTSGFVGSFTPSPVGALLNLSLTVFMMNPRFIVYALLPVPWYSAAMVEAVFQTVFFLFALRWEVRRARFGLCETYSTILSFLPFSLFVIFFRYRELEMARREKLAEKVMDS